MGFKNFLEDAASFAVPAASTLAMAALAGNPVTAGPTLLAALASGSGGFARNEQNERLKKAQKRQGKNQATANLINTLSPRANYQAQQAEMPKAGLLETIGRGTQQGIQAYQMADALRRQNAAADSTQTINDAKIEALRGADAAARKGMAEVTTSGSGPASTAYTMPVQTVTAEAPTEAPPLGYLSGAAAERRDERRLDIAEAGNEAAVSASQSKWMREVQNQLQLANIVAQNPNAFHSMGEKKGDAMLGLMMAGPEGVALISQVAGRPLTAAQEAKLQEGGSALQTVRELDGIYMQLDQGGDTGVIGSTFNMPGGSAAALHRRASQLLAILPSQLRNARETGVMNDRDEARYITQIPDLTAFDQTSERSAFNKMRDGLEADYTRFANGLASTGVQLGAFANQAQPTGGTVDPARVDAFMKRLEELVGQ